MVSVNIDDEPQDGMEIPLLGDGVTVGVVQVGDTVRRPRRPFRATVQAYLAHLHEQGFTAAPVPMGYDSVGREVLSFMTGDVPREPLPDWAATCEVLVELARLVRRLHDASESWRPPRDAVGAPLPGSSARDHAVEDRRPDPRADGTQAPPRRSSRSLGCSITCRWWKRTGWRCASLPCPIASHGQMSTGTPIRCGPRRPSGLVPPIPPSGAADSPLGAVTAG